MKAEAFDVLGVVLEWKVRGEQTGGQYCLVTAMVPPGVMVPPHQHLEPESFYLLEGEGEFASLIDGELVWATVRAGDVVNIPSDSVHGFRNTSSSNMRCIITADPGIQGFFDEAGLPLSANPSAAYTGGHRARARHCPEAWAAFLRSRINHLIEERGRLS